MDNYHRENTMKVITTIKMMLMIALYGSTLPLYASAKDQKSAAKATQSANQQSAEATTQSATARMHVHSFTGPLLEQFDLDTKADAETEAQIIARQKAYNEAAKQARLNNSAQSTTASTAAAPSLATAQPQMDEKIKIIFKNIVNCMQHAHSNQQEFMFAEYQAFQELSTEDRNTLVAIHDELGNSLLSYAAFYDFSQALSELIEAGANVDHVNNRGQTILMIAIEKASYEMIVELVQYSNAHINFDNSTGYTALFHAMYMNNAVLYQQNPKLHGRTLKVINLLLTNGASTLIGARSPGAIAEEVIKENAPLYTFPSDWDAKKIADEKQRLAANDKAILKALKDRENVELKARIADIDSERPRTLFEKFSDLVFLLYRVKDRACAQLEHYKKTLSPDEFTQLFLIQNLKTGFNLLFFAISVGHLEFIESLLAEKEHINFGHITNSTREEYAHNIISFALKCANATLANQMIKLLLPHCDPNQVFDRFYYETNKSFKVTA